MVLLTDVPERCGLLIEQRKAIMADRHFEDPRRRELDHHVNWATGNPEMLDHALFVERLKRGDRPAGSHRRGEADVLGVVQVAQLQAVDSE